MTRISPKLPQAGHALAAAAAGADLRGARQRYVERAIRFGAWVLIAQGLLWCVIFAIAEIPSGVALHTAFIGGGIALLVLARRGEVVVVRHLAFWLLLVYCLAVLVFFDSGKGGWPRVTHLYLLPIILAIGLLFSDAARAWRILYAGLCLVAFVAVERSLVAIPTVIQAGPIEATRHIGVPFNTLVAVAMTLLMLRKFAGDVALREVSLRGVNTTIETLLERMLPRKILQRLRETQETFADEHENVSILFADIVGFTRLASRIAPQDLVNLLNDIFSRFDVLVERHGVEKIKTLGDAYMAVAGIPEPRSDHALALTRLAVEMQAVMKDYPELSIRVGINSGHVVAGIIGRKRFIYDLWGDAVNLASGMESSGAPTRIHVSASTARELAPYYHLEPGDPMPSGEQVSAPTFFVGYPMVERSDA